MCDAYEWEMLKKSYAEDMARRARERAEAEAKVTPRPVPSGRPAKAADEPLEALPL